MSTVSRQAQSRVSSFVNFVVLMAHTPLVEAEAYKGPSPIPLKTFSCTTGPSFEYSGSAGSVNSSRRHSRQSSLLSLASMPSTQDENLHPQ